MQLDYQVHERAPAQIVLESDSQRHTLTFPLTPRWIVILSIVTAFGFGTLQFGAVAWMIWVLWFLRHSVTMPGFYLWPLIFVFFIGGMTAMALAWYELGSYLRYGHLPRRLSLDAGKSTLSHRAQRSHRCREWPLSDIRSARLSPLRNLLRRPAGAALSIRLRRWPIWIGVRCRQSDLPQVRTFAQALSRQLPAGASGGLIDDESPGAPGAQPLNSKK